MSMLLQLESIRTNVLSRMRSEGFLFYIGGLGLTRVRVTLFWRPQPFATVRHRSQPFATVHLRPSWPQSCRAYGKSRKNVACLMVKRCGHVVLRGRHGTSSTFQHVSRCVKSRFVWQAQYFCYIFKRWVAFLVASAALWTPPMSFCVAGAAL